jgi:hypothetical protein
VDNTLQTGKEEEVAPHPWVIEWSLPFSPLEMTAVHLCNITHSNEEDQKSHNFIETFGGNDLDCSL